MKERRHGYTSSFWQILKENPVFPIVRKVRSQISPEIEYVAGAVATYTYLATLIDPSLLPPVLEEVAKILEKIPLYKVNLALSSGVSSAMVVDGANRIATERLPLLKISSVMLVDDLKNKFGK